MGLASFPLCRHCLPVFCYVDSVCHSSPIWALPASVLNCVDPLCTGLFFAHICWYLHMIKYICVAFFSWSFILMLLFTLGHVSLCFYFHLVMCPYFDIRNWLCISVGYSHLVMYPYNAIHTLSCILILILSVGYVFPCYYTHLIMYLPVDIHMWSYVHMLISTLVHVPQYCY